jgi:hypothetical protein
LLEDNASYEKLYNKGNDVKSYYIAALLGKKIESFLRSKEALTSSDKNNIKFYITYSVAANLTNNKFPAFRALSTVEPKDITQETIIKSFDSVLGLYNELGGGDKLAKGQEMIKQLKEIVSSEIEL